MMIRVILLCYQDTTELETLCAGIKKNWGEKGKKRPWLTARILTRRDAAGPERNRFLQSVYLGWSTSRDFPIYKEDHKYQSQDIKCYGNK